MEKYQRYQRPCKFGLKCKDLLKGFCKYEHSEQDIQGLQSHQINRQPNFRPRDNKHQVRGHKVRMFNQEKYNKRNSYRNFEHDKPRYQNSIKLCGDYHMDMCQRQRCKFKHDFNFGQQQIIRRLFFSRNIPSHIKSKLSKVQGPTKQYFSVRVNNVVQLYDWNVDTQLIKINETVLPQQNFHFFMQKKQYIYFAYDSNIATTIGFYDMSNDRLILIADAHSGKVTGMTHFSNLLISLSIDGKLQVWQPQKETYVWNKELTQQIADNVFSETRKDLQLLWLSLQTIGESTVLLVGTNDNRILILSECFEYRQFNLAQEQMNKIYKIISYTFEKIPHLALLIWSNDHTVSTVLSLDLLNHERKVLKRVHNGGQMMRNIHVMQVIGQYLVLGDLKGKLMVYRIDDMENAVGQVQHQGSIGDIIYLKSVIENSSVELRLLIVLQKKSEDTEGSLGIYLIK